MSEIKNPFNNLIQAGMTRDAFIARYKEIAEEMRNEPASSVFFGQYSDDAVSRMFDVIQLTSDDGDNCDNATISENDIKRLSAFDGDEESISEEDMMKRFEEILSQNQVVTGSADCDVPSITPAQSMDILFDLKNIKTQIASTKKQQLQAELEDLISEKVKDNPKYKAKKQELDNARQELESKKRQLASVKRDMQITKADIERKQAKANGIEDENEKSDISSNISDLQNTYNTYSSTASRLSSDISRLTATVKNLKSDLDEIIEEFEAENKQAIKQKQAEIDEIDRVLSSDLNEIDTRIEIAQNQILEQARQAGADSARYANMGNDGHIGKTAAQALSNAAGEIGVREATGHNDGAQIAKYRNGLDNNAAWCASFVSWCYKGNDVFGYQASVSGIQMAAQRQGLYSEIGTYTPKPGDVMIQKSNGASHTGIVESVDPDGTIHTIEGNASNSVRRVTYKPGSNGYGKISGWVRMSDRG